MKKTSLLLLALFSVLSSSAQYHKTIVPDLVEYNNRYYDTDIERNMNRLLNEVIYLDFSDCGTYSTIYSIEKTDTIWIRKVKNPLKAKQGRHYKLNSRKATVEELQGKEFLVKSIDRKIMGEYQRSFYSVLTLQNIRDTTNTYTWDVMTSSNYTNVSNIRIRIRSKRWDEIVNNYIHNGEFYYYLSPVYAKPSKENGHTKYVKIHYNECDFFLGGDFFAGRYISKYKDEEGRDYTFDEYTLKNSELPIIEKEYNKIVTNNIAIRKSAGNYYYSLSKVTKPANKSIRYGKTIEQQSDGLFSKYFYEDNVLSILIYGGEKQFEFSLTNKTKNSIKVVWNEASIVDENNLVSKVVHKGVKYMDANNTQPPTTIPSGASISELVAPTNRIKYSDGWYQQSIIASNRSNDINVVGKTIKVLLPIEIAGVVNEYVFCFTIGWKFTYPEYQD